MSSLTLTGVLALVTVVWVVDFAYSMITRTAMDPQIHAVFLVVAGAAFTGRGALRRGNTDDT